MVVAAKRTAPCARQGGFTFLGLLLAVALLSVGLTATSEIWFTTAQRQRNEQSQWVAQEFVRAIGSYYESGPGGVKRFPSQLEDLLEDRRSGGVRRHLRQVYLNPYTGKPEWELVPAPGGGFRGVKVRTGDAPRGEYKSNEFFYAPLP